MELIFKEGDNILGVINLDPDDLPSLLRVSSLAQYMGVSRQYLYKYAESHGWEATIERYFQRVLKNQLSLVGNKITTPDL